MRILLVEDDKSLAMAIAYKLKKERFEVTVCEDGQQALFTITHQDFDVVLLDRMLPGLHGDLVIKAVREKQIPVPVMMLTAMDGIKDRVSGLDAGADDYLVKPFAMEELMARIRALLRRTPEWMPRNVLALGDITCDVECAQLSCGELMCSLSRREADLMEFLLRNAGQILPRNVLLDRVWGDAIVENNNLDIYIHFLRKHLREIRSATRIETVRGIGYRLAVRA